MLLTAPLLTWSLATSSWRQVTASLTTCQTTWFCGSLKNSRCHFKNANLFTGRKHHLPNVILFAVWSFQAPSYDSVLQTAQSIAQQAHDLAYDPNYMSPFAQFACDNGLNVRGTYIDSPVSESKFSWAICGIFNCTVHLPDSHILACFSRPAGGKPDDITVLLSIVAEYTDWTCVLVLFELVFMRARLVLPSPLPESSTCSPKDGRWEASWHDTCFPVELMTNHVLYCFQTVFVLECERQQAAMMLLFFFHDDSDAGGNGATQCHFVALVQLKWCNENSEGGLLFLRIYKQGPRV